MFKCILSLYCAALLSTVDSDEFTTLLFLSMYNRIVTFILGYFFCLFVFGNSFFYQNCRESCPLSVNSVFCFFFVRHNNPQYFFSSSFRVMCNGKGQLLFCILMSSFQNAAHPGWKEIFTQFQKYRCLNCLRCLLCLSLNA